MMAAALASGGSMTNYEPGKERLLACRKAGARILPTNEAMAQALQNEEVGICIMWKARAVQWQKAGAKVETVAPKEGIPLYISGFVIPKNAPNKDGAHVWLNEMLQPSAQEAFAEDMGYNGTVTNAKIPPATEKRIGFSADERKRLIDLDYGYLAKNDAALQGVVGQDVQGMNGPPRTGRGRSIMAAVAAPPVRAGAPGWTAAAMIAPASIVVTIGIVLPVVILFRYSLNQFTPAKVMVDAVTVENYVKFFTDPFYRRGSVPDDPRGRRCARRSAWCWPFRWPTASRARVRASRICC